jgi:hypothetical protein
MNKNNIGLRDEPVKPVPDRILPLIPARNNAQDLRATQRLKESTNADKVLFRRRNHDFIY